MSTFLSTWLFFEHFFSTLWLFFEYVIIFWLRFEYFVITCGNQFFGRKLRDYFREYFVAGSPCVTTCCDYFLAHVFFKVVTREFFGCVRFHNVVTGKLFPTWFRPKNGLSIHSRNQHGASLSGCVWFWQCADTAMSHCVDWSYSGLMLLGNTKNASTSATTWQICKVPPGPPSKSRDHIFSTFSLLCSCWPGVLFD